MKFTIAGETFKTKRALEERIRGITAGPLGELSDADYPFALDLFQKHPSADEKIGTGVRRILIALAAPYNTRCFVIERTDGSKIDISWRECLAPSTPIDWFRAACRTAVVGQVQAAKGAAFDGGAVVLCPITSELLDREHCHVDHAAPWTFVAIADAFMAERSLDPAKLAYDDSGTQSQFIDTAIVDDFAAFHRERASLRVVSSRANLSILRRRA